MKTKPNNETVVYVNSFQPESRRDMGLRIFLGFVPDNYVPENVIREFWERYHPIEARDIFFQFLLCTSFSAERLHPLIDLNEQRINEFYEDIQNLLEAVYFLNRYAKRRKKLVIKKGGGFEG